MAGSGDDVCPEKLLAEHVVLRCNDVATFHAYIAGIEGRHERKMCAEPAEFELRRAALGRVELAVAHASITMSLSAERSSAAAFLLQLPLSGSVALELDGQAYSVRPGGGVIISPLQRVRRAATPGWTMAFRLDGGFVRSRLAARGAPAHARRLAFQPLLTTNAAEVSQYCLFVVEAIDRGVASPGGSVAAALETGLVDLLLETQPHTCGELLANAELAARSARLRAVTDHLQRHLGDPLSVEQLAEIAGCSVRSLQAAFLDLCGLTPMAFVRQHRLARARELLEDGSGARVHEVAAKTGFTQLGRFATTYRAMYGESPSETVRRTARQNLGTP